MADGTDVASKRNMKSSQKIISAILVTIALILSSQHSAADIPDRSSRTALSGMYQVSASTDPMFPMQQNQEWFLDFGEGTRNGAFSGTVAVSLRENPNVRVRIMVWQYFPEQGTLVIGNQTNRGSKGAVARAVWNIGANSQYVVLQRHNVNVTLRRADS